MGKNIYILYNRGVPLLAFESFIEASKEKSERSFLDDEGIYKVVETPFMPKVKNLKQFSKKDVKQ